MRRPLPALFAVLGIAATAAVGGADVPKAPAVAPPASVTAPNDLDRMLADLDAREVALQKELEGIAPALEVTRARMLARGRAYYRFVRAGLLPIGGGFEALVDHAAKVARTRQAIERDAATEAALVKRSADLADRLTRIRAERAPLEVHREAMQRARTALLEADERREAFARAFQVSTRPPDYVAVYGADSGPTDVDARRGFRALKGRVPFPIAGRAEVRRVRRSGGPGLEFAAGPGSSVRSVAAGRVVFADRYDDYGLTVILDHGDSYFSLYAGLGASEAHVGESVAAGAPIGTAAAGSVLYFELRNGAETIDPAPWLGL